MEDSPITTKLSEDGENDKLRYGSSSMQGWRDTMEDAHVAILDMDDKTSFFGVYDGHGGEVVAKFCAKYLHQQVLSNEAYEAGDIETSLRRAFFRMDDMMQGQRGWRELAALGDSIEGVRCSPRSVDINKQLDTWPLEDGPHSDFTGPTSSGSTACVALIKDKKLFVANAGDSRCVISRKGQAYNLSKDHKPYLGVESERILKAGGSIHNERIHNCLNMSRAIGDMEYKQNKSLLAEEQMVTADPDIKTIELCDDDDFLVVACDGIWDCMSSQELVNFIRRHINSETKLSTICEKVVDKCVAPDNWGEACDDEDVSTCVEGFDNMTIILVQFKKP